MIELTGEQLERYSRNMVLAEFGPKGQEKLRQGRVLVVGAGGLGSPAALYLAAAGIGTLGIIDPDRVELSNLQRQILHDTRYLGQAKTFSAGERIHALNPDVEVRTWTDSFSVKNALDLIAEFDFIIDGTDNFSAKFLINDACVMVGKPYSHAGVLGMKGQVLTVIPGRDAPCLRCILPERPAPEESPACAGSGVLGVAVGLLGTIQAAEALKVLTGMGEPLLGRLLLLDALSMRFRLVGLRRNPDCPVCSSGARITTLNATEYQ